MIGVISAGALATRAARAVGRVLLKRWYLVPIALLALQLHLVRGSLATARRDLASEQLARKLDGVAAKASTIAAERGFAQRQVVALSSYADRLSTREPIILRSTDTVREYANTTAGRAACLGADRVHGLDALDTALFADDPGRADRGAAPVPADASRAPARR